MTGWRFVAVQLAASLCGMSGAWLMQWWLRR
jgi:hypothetical protein